MCHLHSVYIFYSHTNVRGYRFIAYVSFIYGVATLSRIDKMTGLFCKRALYKRRYSAKETCHFIDPTDRSHPIVYIYVTHIKSMYYLRSAYICYSYTIVCVIDIVYIYASHMQGYVGIDF